MLTFLMCSCDYAVGDGDAVSFLDLQFPLNQKAEKLTSNPLIHPPASFFK